ncbi:P-loop NTPase fold protein [Oenococcus oeni]|uniref:P-loop NTPase fold protein n=1 Tax=Oenococcus oeni TaxID=1247 RepID=UPI0008F870F3|nr:P-loop NTPase fold protein [Oenococcus oeni]OIM61746.1 hypothetical protein ATX87_10000 [Oenococcus oeni]
MDRIDKAIEFYLASDDDQAFQIDGPWGAGKTYYVQNAAKDIIKKSGYKVVYVSLSNMQDLAEVKTEERVQIL